MRLDTPDVTPRNDGARDASAPPPLKGWLSDVFLPAVLHQDGATVEGLMRRLGHRASLAEPLFGKSEGENGLAVHVRKLGGWLLARSGHFDRERFVTGTDRDASLGQLTLLLENRSVTVPAAVIAEKRRAREVELRVYFALAPFRGAPARRAPVVPPCRDLPLPGVVTDVLAGLARGASDAVLDAFETEGTLQEANGTVHTKSDGTLARFLAERFPKATAGAELVRCGAADDGDACALEFTLTRLGGHSVEPQAGLAVFERGSSGRLKRVQFYSEWPA